MSERNTPETNKRIDEREPKDVDDLIQELYAADRHCRRLERQRDAAVEALKIGMEIGDGCSRGFLAKFQAQARAVLREIEGES